MRGINMSKSELWKKFLENMKELTSSTSFDVWCGFRDQHQKKNADPANQSRHDCIYIIYAL